MNVERRAGIEPANTGFADLRVSRFATGAYETVLRNQQKRITAHRKMKNPPRLQAGGSSGFVIPVSESSPEYTPAKSRPDSSTNTSRDCKNGPLNPLLVGRHPFCGSPMICRLRAIRSNVKRSPSQVPKRCVSGAGPNTSSANKRGALSVEPRRPSFIHPVGEKNGSVTINAHMACRVLR